MMDQPPNNILLSTIKDADLPDFTLKGREFIGKVVDIYDGDTCKIVMFLDNRMTKFTCRLVGLDTPEIKPPMSKPNRDEEIAAAKRCRHRLIQLSTNCRVDMNTVDTSKKDIKAIINENTKLVRVSCGDFDKYGRLLVTLYDANFDANALESAKSYNTILIEERFAKPYNGGTKDMF